jgi:hypothetical protein
MAGKPGRCPLNGRRVIIVSKKFDQPDGRVAAALGVMRIPRASAPVDRKPALAKPATFITLFSGLDIGQKSSGDIERPTAQTLEIGCRE